MSTVITGKVSVARLGSPLSDGDWIDVGHYLREPEFTGDTAEDMEVPQPLPTSSSDSMQYSFSMSRRDMKRLIKIIAPRTRGEIRRSAMRRAYRRRVSARRRRDR